MKHKTIAFLVPLGLLLGSAPALANEPTLKLSPRERDAVVRNYVRPDGRVVPLTENNGIPFLFGLGDARGKPSSIPLVNGATATVEASTPSSGLVPGQNPE